VKTPSPKGKCLPLAPESSPGGEWGLGAQNLKFRHTLTMQLIIVYIIIACAVGAIVRYAYRQVRGKSSGCNCSSCAQKHCCSNHGGECHCHDTHS